MRNNNSIFAVFALAFILTAGLACNLFTSADSAKPVETRETANTAVDTTTKSSESPKIEKADFEVTAEDYDKEFTKKGAKEEDLKKYANKNIAVAGRISLLSLEKKGTTPPWVTLFAPGVLHGVSCYFDDDNLEQMKRLKMDKMVTVQGFQDDFIVPEVSPRLEHCIVVKAE